MTAPAGIRGVGGAGSGAPLPVEDDAELLAVLRKPLTADERQEIRDRARATGDWTLTALADALERREGDR